MHSTAPLSWPKQPYHQAWLTAQANGLFTSFQRAINPRGGFFDLDDAGEPIRDAHGSGLRGLHATTRMVFCYALGDLMGHPGSRAIVDHGMDYLWSAHRDPVNGGYFWQVGDAGPADPAKQAYGHAFVLLAGAAAKRIGHPDADRLLADGMTVLLDRFWEPAHGATSEEYTADWKPLGTPYRGQNSNMHLTEALMAVFSVTSDQRCLAMAESIADLLIRRVTAANGWRLPEHFTEDWTVDRDYAGSEMFRPAGTTPGHWLEWSRLLVQLWQAGGRRHGWMTEAADRMFRQAVAEGWDRAKGGFFYTLDWNGQPLVADKIWWPLSEGIGAAVFLGGVGDRAFYEGWYRRIWNFVATHLIDARNGRWIPHLDEANRAKTTIFIGRPDIYHALQACLIPLFPADGGLLETVAGPSGPAL